LIGYPLDRARHEEIRRELEARAVSAEPAPSWQRPPDAERPAEQPTS
jgi:hypothetical protein